MERILNIKRAHSIIRDFKKARVLVIGDLIVDHFIWGRVTRISPEAPVPVVDVTKETIMLGGSANVVNNVRSLGARCYVAGVVGKDSDGKTLVDMLRQSRIPTEGVIIDDGRPTTIKTRIIAHHQQVVRFDREKKEEIKKRVEEKVLNYARKAIGHADIVVISDYAKGIVTEALTSSVMEIASRAGRPVVIDPKVEHFDYYRRATLVTPNNIEAGVASGIEIEDEKTLETAGRALLRKLECEALLVTRGESGMSLFLPEGETHIPTVAREVYDVSGAGDTVIGVAALSLAAGASFKEAAVLANLAAGIVVEKLGTATVTPAELMDAVSTRLKK